MKYGSKSTWKGKRRFGRHGSGGHKPNKSGTNKGSYGVPPKPSQRRYFDSLRWLENKRKRIAKHRKNARVGV